VVKAELAQLVQELAGSFARDVALDEVAGWLECRSRDPDDVRRTDRFGEAARQSLRSMGTMSRRCSTSGSLRLLRFGRATPTYDG
jgi:hypothetical protein